jgi:hypothetical protein
MGLLLKYILEKQYSIEIEFSQDVIIDKEPFFFHDLAIWRENDAKNRNNGRIRCTVDCAVRRYIEGTMMWSSSSWRECHLALTNIGAFLFDKQDLAAKAPECIWIHELSFS